MTRRAFDTLIGACLGTGATAVHVLMAHFVAAPIVQPDELGYIDNARRLALGGLRPITGYYPGLSFLIAPVWRLTSDPIVVWRAAVSINSICAGLTTVVVWVLVPRLSSKPVRTSTRLLITVAVGAYPALALYSNLSLSESLFAFVATCVVLLAWFAFRRGPLAWAALGSVTGLLAAVHPRGLAVVVAVVFLSLLVLQPWRPGVAQRPLAWQRLIGVVGGVVIGLALARIGVVLVRPAPGTGLGLYQAGSVVSRAVSPGALRLLVVGLAGQVLYLTIATAGLAPLGIIVGAGSIRSRAAATPASFATAVAGVGALGVLAMSVLFLNGGTRADQVIYGRYNEGVVAIPIVIAVVWLLSGDRPRRCLAWLACGVAGLGVGVIALRLGLTEGQRDAVLNPATVLSLDPILRHTAQALEPFALGAFGAVVLALVVLSFVWSPRLSLVALGMVFVLLSADTFRSYVLPGASARSRQDVIASTIEAASHDLGIKTRCVGWDAGIDFTYFNDRFLMPGVDIEPVNGRPEGPSCGPFIVSSHPDFFTRYNGSQIVTVENDVTQILYVLPGPTLTRLQKAGWLLPAVIPGPLPINRQRAVVVAAHSPPRSLPTGADRSLRVSALNAGGSPWPNERGLRQGQFVVRVTARWFHVGQQVSAPGQPGPTPLTTTVAELPKTLLPGQKVTVSLPLDARLPPGHYVVEIALYQELVGAIPGGSFTFAVTVTAR